MTNRLALSASLVGRGALRTTPAGLPALDLTLRHESSVLQQGHPRQVRLDMHAKAVGPVTERLLGQALGSEAEFEGFVGAQRNGRGVVFHIESIHAPHSD